MTTVPTASNWYYSNRGDSAGRQIGPLTWEQFYLSAQAGTLAPDDLVWHPQFADWVPAAQVPGLFAAAAAPFAQAPHVTGVPSGGHRRSWLYWAVPLVVLILAGAGLGAYFGFLRGEGDGGPAGSTATAVVSDTTGAATAPATTASTMPPTTGTIATTTTLAATTTTMPPAIAGSHDPVTAGDFTFKMAEVRIADEMADFPGGPWSNYKGSLTMTSAGLVPTDLTPGDRLLLIFVTLETGDGQSFLNADLRLLEGASSRSPLVIMNEVDGKAYIFVYGVSPSSNAFVFLCPDNVTIDLTPLIALPGPRS